MDVDVLQLVEQLGRLTGGALAFLLLLLLLTDRLIVSKIRYERELKAADKQLEASVEDAQKRYDDMVASYERMLVAKDRELEKLTEAHDWWKDATVTALRIGEVAVERAEEGDR